MTQPRLLSLILLPALAAAADYQLCFLEDGPEAGKIEAARAKELQAAHMGHIGAMWKSGDLESAGPISGLTGSRGIFIFSAPAAEAARLASADPKVVAGDLKINCQTWRGPAQIGKTYREAYGKPGFKETYVRRVGIVLKTVRPAAADIRLIASGPLTGGEDSYFAVLDTEDLPKIKKLFPEAKVFLWFHDAQVWNGVS